VFDHFDVNSDGHIAMNEMADVFSHLGVKLDEESLKAIFQYVEGI
jgi:Ca2+-binding EF-hand superfamily protein